MRKTMFALFLASTSLMSHAAYSQKGLGNEFIAPVAGSQQAISVEELTALQAIHIGNLTEIRASLIAFDKETSLAAKNYARLLLVEHSQNEIQLQQMALDRGVSFDEAAIQSTLIPMKVRGEAALARLRVTGSSRFQAAFAKAMEESHADLLSQLDRLQPNLVENPLQEFVTNTYAAVQNHEQLAQGLKAENGI